jgi:hypothetical protein
MAANATADFAAIGGNLICEIVEDDLASSQSRSSNFGP